ncbi:hypothetical protein SARC_10299 [Sphaeroforma arctica JP610]|uniref:Uncharacterized protein n=1 Tax=Sphaeroforma arctica JP610 TaxID=667725 RepID=A0A0L0FKD4_9EUKA|nr:hypothetical protein SARC_10299 [Sphaeroforma arctica JP610]KNC77237.1 hypothetical protein SARC_10299 [Sphaeroforma arctica JP610]|eukprot:XP_014151139.1 hypothetical protein SARC_10299 [Sphaeroforma arctica JP610]
MYKIALRKDVCDSHNSAGQAFVKSRGRATATTNNPARPYSRGMALGGMQPQSKETNKQCVGNVNTLQAVTQISPSYQRMEMGGLTSKKNTAGLTSRKNPTNKDTRTQHPEKSPSLKQRRRSFNPFKKVKRNVILKESSLASTWALRPTEEKTKSFDTTSQSDTMSLFSFQV